MANLPWVHLYNKALRSYDSERRIDIQSAKDAIIQRLVIVRRNFADVRLPLDLAEYQRLIVAYSDMNILAKTGQFCTAE